MTCRVLGFSTQAFYKWRKAPLSQRDWDDAHLINAARDIHADDPAFGYRFIADELPGRGITAGENRVARLCSQERIWSIFAKKRGLNRRSGPPVHDDLVQRQFGAPAANQVWLADITEHRTDEGKLYLCAIKDVHSNRIVGYSIDSRMKSSLAVAALDHAVALRAPVATIVHSDRGSQFRSRKFVHALSHNGLHGSMGRVGACGDNAAMEMLLSVSSGDRGGFEKSEEMARVVPLQTPHGFTFGLAIADPTGDVGLGWRVNLGPGQDDRVQCTVQLAVTTT
ncbi:integrase catalytic subunit [Mycobacterium intracellulare ATCC 13950]|uniref:Integrase catalytic subunit n=1 Tax=Mycobacterium intracellulare (strain ATCC 13950 / DSM 43223 / JCM 6384 / NCTC 13025 / 3600) TaxID=487521 RepID=H8IUN4_MYCIA|nr:integrase catalytic subunit [Mycobacterium intracellulare ATCC 13950]